MVTTKNGLSQYKHKLKSYFLCSRCYEAILKHTKSFDEREIFFKFNLKENCIYKVKYRNYYLYVVNTLTFQEKLDILESMEAIEVGNFPYNGYRSMLKDLFQKQICKIQPMSKVPLDYYFFYSYTYGNKFFKTYNLMSSNFLVEYKQSSKQQKDKNNGKTKNQP